MKTIFLTGASSGIGRSLALRLAGDGSAVALIARRRELLDSLAEEIHRAGGKALAVPCDVTDHSSVVAAVQRVEQAFGPIDTMIACAGGDLNKKNKRDAFVTSEINDLFALNVLGTAHCIEAILPGMLRRGRGHIVAIGSLAGYRGLPGAAGYSAAKGALANMIESLRLNVGSRGIDVTLILPGFVRTNLSRTKKRPFEIELEDATRRMHRAIVARRRRYAFPLPLVMLVGLGRLMPAALYDRLLAGRNKKGCTQPSLGKHNVG
jgi:short-subunit dehydrogenase